MATEEKVTYKQFMVGYSKYKTTLSEKFKRRKPYTPPNPKEIRAVLPGTIEEIMVKVGKEVVEGDEIMIFEAMKMHNRVHATYTGRVKSISIKKGDRVMKDQLLLEFE
ncbi:MAG: acetyl-CoA carboxylase biotin carboxyl carrier protein subunit [Bacteroidales bacterium]|nr:acetyl-CoA carboxylase biotin carboxyl carrier protein subunit [Bacteroidales bacterium]